MTAVKAEAIQMMEHVPDSLVKEWIVTMRKYINNESASAESKIETRVATSAAFNNFVSHCKKSTITDDYKEELADSLEQRYESIH